MKPKQLNMKSKSFSFEEKNRALIQVEKVLIGCILRLDKVNLGALSDIDEASGSFTSLGDQVDDLYQKISKVHAAIDRKL